MQIVKKHVDRDNDGLITATREVVWENRDLAINAARELQEARLRFVAEVNAALAAGDERASLAAREKVLEVSVGIDIACGRRPGSLTMDENGVLIGWETTAG